MIYGRFNKSLDLEMAPTSHTPAHESFAVAAPFRA